MLRIRRLTTLGLPALLVFAACEDSTAPELASTGEPGIPFPIETLQGEVDASVDPELTGALIEDLRFALTTEAGSASASLSEAEAAFAAAATAHQQGDAETAAARAEEARMALGGAWSDARGDRGLDELFGRARDLRASLDGADESDMDVDRVRRALDRILDRAGDARAKGNRRRAAADLVLAGQIVDHAWVDVDRDGDGHAAKARFSVARAKAAVELAERLLPDAPTDSQLRLLARAIHLTREADAALANGSFRRAFALGRRAESTALLAVIDVKSDRVNEADVRALHELAETLLREAAAIPDPTTIQQRLIHMAEKQLRAGERKWDGGNLRAIGCFWRSAVTSSLALG